MYVTYRLSSIVVFRNALSVRRALRFFQENDDTFGNDDLRLKRL
jgi:hypothetical protein